MSVTLTGSKNAVEQAVFEAMIERGSNSRFTALGFTGSNVGNSLVLVQFAYPNHALSLGWPSIQYPNGANVESQSLSSVKNALDNKRRDGHPVAALVIEPTNSATGHTVSDSFISQLGSLAKDYEAALIVDETNTGCGASGKGFWQYKG